MARRLNALLHEIEVRPAARMTTKEQLTTIFALEIEAMHDEIEGLDRAAKHVGTLRAAVHREADRQVGWAYRLLEAYGVGKSFPSSPAAKAAKRCSKPESIRTTFRSSPPPTWLSAKAPDADRSLPTSCGAWPKSVSTTPPSTATRPWNKSTRRGPKPYSARLHDRAPSASANRRKSRCAHRASKQPRFPSPSLPFSGRPIRLFLRVPTRKVRQNPRRAEPLLVKLKTNDWTSFRRISLPQRRPSLLRPSVASPGTSRSASSTRSSMN